MVAVRALPLFLQCLEHLEAAARFERHVDQNQVGIDARQIGDRLLGVVAVADQLASDRLDGRCEQPGEDRRILDHVDVKRAWSVGHIHRVPVASMRRPR